MILLLVVVELGIVTKLRQITNIVIMMIMVVVVVVDFIVIIHYHVHNYHVIFMKNSPRDYGIYQYDTYKEKTKNDLSQVENDFIKQLETETKQLKNKK